MRNLGRSLNLGILVLALLVNSWALVCPNHLFAYAAPEDSESANADGHDHAQSTTDHRDHGRESNSSDSTHGHHDHHQSGLQETEYTCHVAKDFGGTHSNERAPDQSLAQLTLVDPDVSPLEGLLISDLLLRPDPHVPLPENPPQAIV